MCWWPWPIWRFRLSLAALIAREIVAGKNWRNLVVLAMLGVFILGNAFFHWEAAKGGYAAQGYGLRLGLGAGHHDDRRDRVAV